jgi:DNA-binding winged helix-turn-helix (wHTH) protein
VVDVITEEAAHEVMAGAGLRDEEDVFASVLPASRRRLIWLGINLVTAFVAGLVVQRFEGTIAQVAALAALMPIVASMGGIAGTQTVTLIIRGIALGQVEWRDTRWLLMREVGVSIVTGLAMAAVVGVVTVFWLGTWKVTNPEGKAASLRNSEYRVLASLLAHGNRVVSRLKLIELARGRDALPFDRSIDVRISRLRQVLGDDARVPRIIKTVHGEGYVIGVPVERAGASQELLARASSKRWRNGKPARRPKNEDIRGPYEKQRRRH